jgi:CxxC motif-containing protein (DUF1111 family)
MQTQNTWRWAFLAALAAATSMAGCSSAPEEGELGSVVEGLQSGDSLAGLTAAQQALFTTGRGTFMEVEDLADGLGPVFNERACGNCHSVGAVGGAGVQFEVRAGRKTGSTFDPLTASGGSLFDLFSVTNPTQTSAAERALIPGCTLPPNGEPVPSTANVVAKRRTTALFGLGFVDATPDSTFTALAASQPAFRRGRAPLVPNITAGHPTVGKFGWKDQNPTLHQFAGDAYVNEMGITNTDFPVEQAPSGNPALVAACDIVPGVEDTSNDVQQFTDFMTLLAAPPRGPVSGRAALGDIGFTALGCDGCHVRNLRSGASPIRALANQTYSPFSDFLLHDMGSLGDGIGGNGTAGTTEMRTAPLWGLSLIDPTHLLHDGRGTSVEDAILRHEGQARISRDLFAIQPRNVKDNLLAFLKTL